MESVIQRLKESGDALVAQAGRDIDRWKKLRHTKKDLELLLTYCIAEIRFRPTKKTEYENLIVTSNNRFIRTYSAVKPRDKSICARTAAFRGIRTQDAGSVLTYDLVAGKYKTVPLESWQVIDFMPMTEDNVEALDRLVNACIRK